MDLDSTESRERTEGPVSKGRGVRMGREVQKGSTHLEDLVGRESVLGQYQKVAPEGEAALHNAGMTVAPALTRGAAPGGSVVYSAWIRVSPAPMAWPVGREQMEILAPEGCLPVPRPRDSGWDTLVRPALTGAWDLEEAVAAVEVDETSEWKGVTFMEQEMEEAVEEAAAVAVAEVQVVKRVAVPLASS